MISAVFGQKGDSGQDSPATSTLKEGYALRKISAVLESGLKD
jgi:hypothetical protein